MVIRLQSRPVSKKRTYRNLEILDLEPGGNGVAKPEGKVVFVEGTLPGETVDATVVRSRRSHAFARPDAWHEVSPERQEPFCSHFNDCGGCTWQYLAYDRQLHYKHRFVVELISRTGIDPGLIQPIIGCATDREYRNKMDFSFAPIRWITQAEVDRGDAVTDRRALGFHVKGRFDRVLDIDRCYLQREPSNRIRNIVRDITKSRDLSYHDPKQHIGLLRSLIVRTARSGEVMIILTMAEDRPDIAGQVVEELRGQVPEISSAFYLVNPTQNDDISPHEAIHVFGEHTITETCGHLKFAIHPKSFFQTNSLQAERLYEIVRTWIDASGHESVLDLYCGIGSIGLFIADKVGSVFGVESVPEAIERAEENARINQVSNATFTAGDVREVLQSGVTRPDIVILDPPRAGLHPDAIREVLRLEPRQIVYVSCKPATQVRDLEMLLTDYDAIRVQPVDMFPQTFHVENVVDLRRRM